MTSAVDVEDSPFFQEKLASGGLVVRDLPKFDLDSYIQHYDDRTRFDRLMLIGTTSTVLSLDALRLAVQQAERGKDVEAYLTATSALSQVAPNDPAGQVDQKLVDHKLKVIKAESERLEKELKGYRNNLIKESIRMGNEDLGRHYYSTGELAESWKAYQRMRDYCTNANNIVDMLFRLILVGIQQKQWQSVMSQLIKANSSGQKSDSRTEHEPIIKALMGLCSMEMGNFRQAAKEFMVTKFAYGNLENQGQIAWQKEVLTQNDIAVYGGLCALASMDREELREKVLNNPEFRQYLELEPHIRRAISLFCSSKYSACLEQLDAYRTDYLLDVYLNPVLRMLYGTIRSKCIVQYFIPFECVTLEEMTNAFQSTGEGKIETELVEMIEKGVLKARIDLVEGLLIAPKTNSRHAVQEDAIKAAKAYENTLRLRLLQLNMKAAGLEIKSSKQQGGTASAPSWEGEDSEMGGTRRGGRRGIFS
ncbi:PCI-domain-containing protein [Pseudovirgaria hyperparasitica]|uniref:PCI-domain-containing protein n=1 Tax=Pseudovirgaria hyperparasitica TaxID=470096 RepID=A0A6A6W2X2_9PEZI|nr:PCI-domain-containing protein [Pseudovirgaria hyperparasitica]KAF2756364.1 PCI-domain-containing protein [Pseudovirgaria hyperparasitica]